LPDDREQVATFAWTDEPTLLPRFGHLCLRDLTRLSIQHYFTDPALLRLSHESRDKIRDVLSSVLRSAADYGLLVKNPVEGIR